MIERELHDDVTLCDEGGQLSLAARGWSRRPLQRCNLLGHALRKKRWDFWAITTPRYVVNVVVADLDYLGLGSVSIWDLQTRRRIEAAAILPFAVGVPLPETVDHEAVRFDHLGCRIELIPNAARDSLTMHAVARTIFNDKMTVELEIARPAALDTLNVLVPFGPSQFHFTSKQVGLPVRGRVTCNGEAIDLDGAWACLDFGRGIWPYRIKWNWAAASGNNVALNLGGQWTDNTGATENALWVGGRIHKISERVVFEHESRERGWRIFSPDSPRVALRVTPIVDRPIGLNLGLLRARLDWTLGRFDGTILDDNGRPVAFENVLGWTEAADARG